jgi:ubiquinone/menaquinone biosynthesis C-methylase UbiE
MIPNRFLDPRLLASHFHIDKGATVADFGAGSGRFVPAVAEKVGRAGRVIACECQRPLVEALGTLRKKRQYDQVEVQWCDIETVGAVRVPDGTVDFGLLINTLYQLESHRDAVAELRRTLRAGGVVYVVDWIDSFGGIGPTVDQVLTRNTVIDLFEAAYFIYEREYPAGAYHYGLAFKKI